MQRRLAAILAADVVGYSRLMAQDESGTLTRLRSMRATAFDPLVTRHGGRVVKLMGDGALVEFSSTTDAVTCATEILAAFEAMNAESPGVPALNLRIGVHVGEVIAQGRDIYGDAVNIAARLEREAEPGGICLSADAARLVEKAAAVPMRDLGTLQLRNIDQPVHAFAVERGARNGQRVAKVGAGLTQRIAYCRAPDGVNLAYAESGSGPPLVKAANYMSNLEYEWESPIWRHWFTELSAGHRLYRYDERGNGLSDWDVETLSFEAFVQDLEAVVDAIGLERFPLLGISQGCSVSVAYAIRHPERVSCMVFYGGYAAGWRARGNPQEIARRHALVDLIRVGWGQDNPAFRQVFTTLFVPGAGPQQARWFNELQRMTTLPETAARLHECFSLIDVRPLLAQLNVPTLVIHCRGDAVVPLEAGRELAASIPNARFVVLEGDNHIILEQDSCWPRFLAEIRAFLAASG